MLRSLDLLAVLACLLPSALAQKGPDRTEERELLSSRLERDVRSGTERCAGHDDVPAVELLLEVLRETEPRSRNHLSPGHYRDIVWDGLVAIRDHYARARVEYELKTSKDPHVRQWCAELLGIYGDRSFGDSLRKATRDADDDVQRWAARSLGMLKFEPAANELLALARHKNDYVRANAIEALARADAAKGLPPFLAAIEGDRSGGVRCALLGAVPEVCAGDTEALSAKALRDPDWRPRMQAVQNLGAIRTRTAVDALLTALRDGRPAVAARALEELQELTGQPIRQVEVFEKWWADNRATFAFPERGGAPERDPKGTVAYNGLPIDSDHVAFLLDKSFRMQERLQSRKASKDEAARTELLRVLELLDDKIVCNVYNYHVEITALVPKAQPLTPKLRAKAVEFTKAPCDGRQKDIWLALSTVVSDATLDTVYLLSSGEPDTGLYVHWNRVTRHLADLDRFHKIVVHTVACTDSEWFRDQLQKIAEVTGGRFQWFK